ncbi:IclR family transcriptional regulator [Mesorhizobium sp. BR1-1-2]|uniref:IclR family transcriptional regulator n=1 Tax=Mesorhizobium sp. BR1-1-2 TaxID=2876652 RepID=UPI001CCC4F08|nr:IclR family transcriptional regulator [Mesorhizobium sp. BR1-1-2]MBZ9965897.1 IclR family transcriptional regulator [Mesorhizobium sp. BR1-1-2]
MTGNLSLERGLAVLNVLKEADEAVGVRDLARRLEQSAAAVQRILNTLAEQGYVEQSADSRRYRLGPSVLALARHVLSKDQLVGLAEPELQALASRGCFNAFLGVRRGNAGLYLLTVQSRSPVVIRSSPGETFPLHSTALGKAFLIDFDRETIVSVLGEAPLERLTERTTTDPRKLALQIRSSRAIGYTTSLDENFVGLVAIGAPIRDGSGSVVAGISVAYPRSVGPQIGIADVGEQVMAAASRVSAGLGFRPVGAQGGGAGNVA